MAAKIYRINYKSDFILTMNSDAGWAIPFCIKFFTSVPSRAYFVSFDGTTYTHCAYDPSEPTKLVVQFDDHHLPIGDLNYQIAYHFTVADFPNDTEDEVINPAAITTEIDGETYHVMLDFTGETAPEIEFNLPAYANEAERIQNELRRQQNEADRIAAELQREQATAAAVQGAENVNAQLNGTTLTVTNRLGVSTSVNTKGEQGPVGPEGPQGETGISIVSFLPKSETATTLIYTITYSNGYTQDVAIPKGPKGDTGATGPTGPQGPQGDTGVSITGFVETGETETDTLYNVTFSNGTTQQVAIPKGEKGDQGPVGPQGPQGPMGDVAVITPEQQAAFTMYSVPGQNTDGPMTQKAVTDSLFDATNHVEYDTVTLPTNSTAYAIWGNPSTWHATTNNIVTKKVDVNPGEVYKITSNADYGVQIFFMDTYSPSDGAAITCTIVELPANTSNNVTVPEDMLYMVFQDNHQRTYGTPTAQFPQEVSLVTITPVLTMMDELKEEVSNIENAIHSLEPVDISGYPRDPHYIIGSEWRTGTSGVYSRFIPVQTGTYQISAVDSTAVYAVLSDNDTSTVPHFAPNYPQRHYLQAGDSVEVIVESGQYLCVRDDDNPEGAHLPFIYKKIEVKEIVDGIVEDLYVGSTTIDFIDFDYIITTNNLLAQTSTSYRMSTNMYKVGDSFTIVPTNQSQQYYPVGFDENFHFVHSYADSGRATGTTTFNASSYGVKYIYVSADTRDSMSINAHALFKRESIVCATSDTSSKDGADIICPSTDARESLQLAISYGLLSDRKVILMNGRYILNSYITEGGKNACLVVSGFTPSTGETHDMYANRIRFATIEGSNDVLGWADGAILEVSDTLYASVTDSNPLTVLRGMITGWEPCEKASAISLKNLKVMLHGNQKAITCVDFGYTDNARVEHLYCTAFDPLETYISPYPETFEMPIANSECVGVKLTFGSNMDASIFEHISVLGFYVGIDFSGDHIVVNSPSAVYCYYGFTFGKYMHSGGMTLPITIINMTEEHNVCLPIYYANQNDTKVIQILSGNVYWPEKCCQGNIPFDDPRRVAATIPNHNYIGFINYVNGIDPSTGWFSIIQSSLPTSYFAAGSEIYMEQKNMAAPSHATSAVRRTWAKGLGMQCFDTTLNKMVFCVVKNNALAWVDANGTMVDN